MEKVRSKNKWIIKGLLWGLILFFVLAVVFPLLDGDQLEVDRLFLKLLIWLFLGLMYGLAMKRGK